MTSMPIMVCGDPILRKRSQPITDIDDEIIALALDMLDTMHIEDGIGLAAVQIGRPIRLLVTDIGDRAPKGTSKIFINPEILEERGEWDFDEGCLSIPGVNAEITRSEEIKLRYVDGRGQEREDVFNGLQARVLLHEIDHLNGKLFIDYLSPAQRDIVMKKLRILDKGPKKRGMVL